MIVINVDLDGCVYPFVEAMAAATELQGRFGPNRPVKQGKLFEIPPLISHIGLPMVGMRLGETFPTPTKYGIWDDWGMSEGEWNMHFRRGIEDGFVWSEGIPYDGAVKELWELSDAGYHLRIVTKRLVHAFGHKYAVRQTVEWLDKYAVPYRSLAFIGDEGKSYYPADVLIDDTPENLEEFVENVEGAIGILFLRPWNQYHIFAPQLPQRIFLAETWADIRNIILQRKPL